MSKTSRNIPILLHFNAGLRHWMGGLNYLRALVELLATLPAQAQPAITILDDCGGDWGQDLRPLWALSPVRAVIGPEGVILHARDAVERTRLEALPGSERRRDAARQAEAIYPVMAPGIYPLTARHWAWIPDFQYRCLPHFFDPPEWQRREADTLAMVMRPGPLILSSHAALGDLRRFFPDQRATPHVWHFRSLARPCPPEQVATVRARHALPRRFLFVGNQFWAHKDHATAFQALGLLRAQGMEIDLICSGGKEDHRNPGYYEQLFAKAEHMGLGGRVRHLGLLPHADVLACMQAATCIIQPSRFEGWSTLVEDSRALGSPIAASDLPVHAEQLGEGGHFFPTGDATALARLLARLLPDLPDSTPDEGVQAAATAYDRLRREAGRAFMATIAGG